MLPRQNTFCRSKVPRARNTYPMQADMQIYQQGNLLFMICDTIDDFDWQRDMERLSQLPRQAEWEAYVSQFQGCNVDARSDEKWQLMERIF